MSDGDGGGGAAAQLRTTNSALRADIKKLIHLAIDVWDDLGEFGEPKRSYVGTHMDPKTDLILRKSKNLKKIMEFY